MVKEAFYCGYILMNHVSSNSLNVGGFISSREFLLEKKTQTNSINLQSAEYRPESIQPALHASQC